MNSQLLLKSSMFTCTNDPWFCHDGKHIHAFLQGARSPRNAGYEKYSGSIAHLVSSDSLRWNELMPALMPGEPGSMDDADLFSGSTFFHNGTFYLFYTGRNKDEEGRIERIMLATSSDGIHFSRHDKNPILIPDGRHYEALPQDSPDGTVNWRDPDVVYCPDDKMFYMVFCARTAEHQGAIGLASSTDLFEWKALPPLFVNPRSNMMECPHWMHIEGRYFVCYSQGTGWLTAKGRRESLPSEIEDGIYYISGDSIKGIWSDEDRRALVGIPHWEYKPYAGAPLVMNGETLFSYHVFGSGSYSPFKKVIRCGNNLKLMWNPRLEQTCGQPVPVFPVLNDPEGVGYRFSLSSTLGRNGIISGKLCKGSAQRAGILFRADEWGWKGLFVALNFQQATVEFGIQSDPTAVRTRAWPAIEGKKEFAFRLLVLNEVIELFIDDQLALSTCTAAFAGDFGHERVGVMDSGGSAEWTDIFFTPMAMSDARKFW